jgi:hypothetical protein
MIPRHPMPVARMAPALAVLLAAGSASAEEIALRYTLDPAGAPIVTAGQPMIVRTTAPPGVKLPEFTSRQPLFLQATVGEGARSSFVFALDESEEGAGYDRLYADGNQNGDLTDELPLKLTRWSYHKGFKPIRLLIQIGGERVQYHVAVVVEDHHAPAEYTLHPWGYYSGEAPIEGKNVSVALVDGNANGRFDDRSREIEPGKIRDALLIDADGNGAFDAYSVASPEVRPVARAVPIDGRFYALSVRADGSSFSLTPANLPLATLRSGYANFALNLASDDGPLAVRSRDGKAAVPIGEYRITRWQIEQRGRDGSTWVAEGDLGELGATQKLSVKTATPLPRLASPLRARLRIQATGSREFECSLGFTAASGEPITNVARNGEPMPEPRLKILDARGKELSNLPFHYG